MKFSQISTSTTIADTDNIVGVTAGGVDSRWSFTTFLNWLKAKTAIISFAMMDFSTFYTWNTHFTGSSFTITTSDTVYQYNVVDSDPAGGFNIATFSYTVPSGGGGKYDIGYLMQTNSGFSGVFFVHLQVNGVIKKENPHPQNGGFGAANGTFLNVPLAAGDVVRLSAVVSTGSVSVGGSLAVTYSTFTGRRVSS